MPVIESAKKALRNAEAKAARNVEVKAELRRALKNASVETMSKVVSLVDKAAKRNIIHKNKAARIKSALAKMTVDGAPARTKKVVKKAAKKTTAKKTTAKKK